jgi:chitinase
LIKTDFLPATYVDVCETGLKTYTTTYTKTVCGSCAKPTNEPEYPSDWTTSVYVSKTITVTITKPIHPASDVPAYPTGVPSKPEEEKPVYGADYPSQPQQEYPAQPSKAEYPPVYQTLSKAYTPAPYPTAGYGKPAYNASSAYVPKPTGTGSYPTKPTSYSPPAPEFTGAASRASFGFAAVVGVVAFFAL